VRDVAVAVLIGAGLTAEIRSDGMDIFTNSRDGFSVDEATPRDLAVSPQQTRLWVSVSQTRMGPRSRLVSHARPACRLRLGAEP
jgi:hypothetical protein